MDNREDFFNSQEFKDTLDRYERTRKGMDNDLFSSEELTNIAEYYYNLGHRQEAIDTLDYAIRLYPGAAMPLVSKGRIALLDDKDVAKAKHYADLIDEPFDLDCLYLKAEIMIYDGKPSDADCFLHDAMDKIDEDDMPDYILDVANLFIDYNDAERAERWLNTSDDYDLADYKELKARIAYLKGEYEKSEKIFEQLLDEDPYSGHYWNSLASTQLMSNRINESITSSEYSIAINPDDEEAIFNKANGLFALCNYEEAMKYYERYNQLCPEDGMGMMFVGNCLLNMGHAKEALPYYEKASAYFKRQGTSILDVTQCMAFAHSELKQYDKAVDYINQSMELPEANKSDLLVSRGHVLLESGNIKKAVNDYMEALKLSSYSPTIYFRIAISVYDCGYLSIAYRMFKSYNDIHGNAGDEGASYLAYCCLKLHRKYEYMKYLKQAININPTEAKKVLGEIFPIGMNPKDYYDYAAKHLHDEESASEDDSLNAK